MDTTVLVCVTVPGVWVAVEGSHFLQNTGYLVWGGGLGTKSPSQRRAESECLQASLGPSGGRRGTAVPRGFHTRRVALLLRGGR